MTLVTEKINLQDLSIDDLKKVLAEKEKEQKAEKDAQRKHYEHTRNDIVTTLFKSAVEESRHMKALKKLAFESLEDFADQMKAYGDLKESSKGNFSLKSADGKLKVVYRKQRGYCFDERANLAEEKLKSFLESFVKVKDKRIYKMVVSLLERNKVSGDFDIKLINRLYAMENDFEEVLWKEAIQLFKEAYTETATTTYVQFFQQDDRGQWEAVVMDFASIKI